MEEQMDMNPTSGKGFITWAFTGFIGGLAALLLAHFVPQIIPARVQSTKL
jgi:uncharacterized membrane protein YedE/YeeE